MSQIPVTKLKYSQSQIDQRYKKIRAELLRDSDVIDTGNFSQISANDLVTLYEKYNKVFFQDFFSKTKGGNLYFSWSKKMTRSAGKCAFTPKLMECKITISAYLIFQTFKDVQRVIYVNGYECHDRLDALMHVFEHELIHLLEFTLYGKSSCRGPGFKQLAKNIFGHRGTTHQLITQGERALSKFDLKVGDMVTFEIEGKKFDGLNCRITKRATVMVEHPNGQYRDKFNRRYHKFYVPLPSLKKSSKKILF